MPDFETFWKAYPKRNGKKVGKKDCRLWFERNKPTADDVAAMVAWLEVDNGNRVHSQKVFYASLPDPIRFLKREMWEDDIEPIKVAGSVSDICRTAGCNNKWVSNYLCRPCLNNRKER